MHEKTDVKKVFSKNPKCAIHQQFTGTCSQIKALHLIKWNTTQLPFCMDERARHYLYLFNQLESRP